MIGIVVGNLLGNLLVAVLATNIFNGFAEKVNKHHSIQNYKIEKYVDADLAVVTPNKIITLDETEYWKIKAGRCEEIQKITTYYDKKFIIVETGYSEVSYKCKGE